MPVGRKSTQLKIAFFGLLLAAFVVIQYSWIGFMEKDRLQQFKSRVVSGIEVAARNLPALYNIHDTAIANLFQRSFAAKGLNDLPFEYAIGLPESQRASRGFDKASAGNPRNLVLHYELRRTGDKAVYDETMTVVIPVWKRIALKEMGWIILGSVLLSLMILIIFCTASVFSVRRQDLLYDKREMVVKNMMQQLESPLSTVSIAADALRNAKVMHDEGKINYYQQVITEESQRMNEQVEKFLRDIK